MLGRSVGWLVILGHSRAFSDILGHFLSFFHGLGDPSQLPVGDADADADVALAWGCQSRCPGRDLVAVHHDRRLRG